MKPQSETTHFSALIEKRTRRARTRVSLNATADYDARVHACYGDGLARRRSMVHRRAAIFTPRAPQMTSSMEGAGTV